MAIKPSAHAIWACAHLTTDDYSINNDPAPSSSPCSMLRLTLSVHDLPSLRSPFPSRGMSFHMDVWLAASKNGTFPVSAQIVSYSSTWGCAPNEGDAPPLVIHSHNTGGTVHLHQQAPDYEVSASLRKKHETPNAKPDLSYTLCEKDITDVILQRCEGLFLVSVHLHQEDKLESNTLMISVCPLPILSHANLHPAELCPSGLPILNIL